MEKIGFYLDEHIQTSLAEALRQRGVDVLTTQEAGNIALNDYEQLSFAYKKEGLYCLIIKGILQEFTTNL